MIVVYNMEQRSDPKKKKYYTPYDNKMSSHARRQEIIDNVPEHCWWLKQYLRGIYLNNGPKGRK
tara:strand:- start:159 stop:350 length:192 start_codon:yes stop_codon:yes gene_type:complete